MKPVWELEKLEQRDRNLFITGWFFSPIAELQGLDLLLVEPGNRIAGTIPVSIGKARPDVQAVHPRWPTALQSGFVAVGAWPRPPQHRDQLRLRAHLANGQVLQVEIPRYRWQSALAPTRWQRRLAAGRQLWRYAKQALLLLARGQLRTLQHKLRRQLGEGPQAPLPEPRRWQELLASRCSGRVELIVDHRLGGGANQYRERQVATWLEEGASVLTLSFHLPSLSPMLVVQGQESGCGPDGPSQQRFSLSDDDELLEALAGLPLAGITYNTAVSFSQPETIPPLLLELQRRNPGCQLTVLLHDFFTICPSHFLLNAEGQFCNVPNLATCRRCLPRNQHGFTSLFRGDIEQWRQAWGPLLQAATEIVAFSESSAQLLRQAYADWPEGRNWLAGQTITVRPHAVGYMLGQAHHPDHQPEQLVIGVVGQVGYHKGAEVVRQLAATIRHDGGPERIVVIGSLESDADPTIVRQTGPYRHEQLAHEIQRAGVNVVLIPSIWPETFSYVTQEMIELGLPVACFNLGAPAERVSRYPKGLILHSMQTDQILQELRAFFRQLYPAPANPQPSPIRSQR